MTHSTTGSEDRKHHHAYANGVSSADDSPTVSFVVTGFGPFHGVTDNPTTAIVRALPTYSYLSDKRTTRTRPPTEQGGQGGERGPRPAGGLTPGKPLAGERGPRPDDDGGGDPEARPDDDDDDDDDEQRRSSSSSNVVFVERSAGLAGNLANTTHTTVTARIFETSAEDVRRSVDELFDGIVASASASAAERQREQQEQQQQQQEEEEEEEEETAPSPATTNGCWHGDDEGSTGVPPTKVTDVTSASSRVASSPSSPPHQPSERHVVLLHLGVNYRGKIFQVERSAYNDATFRVPDERGYQPKGERILVDHDGGESSGAADAVRTGGSGSGGNGCGRIAPGEEGVEVVPTSIPYGHRLSTTLRVPGLVRHMSETCGFGDRVEPSSDPGRFVCNYAYCYSLDRSRRFNATTAAAAAAALHRSPGEGSEKEDDDPAADGSDGGGRGDGTTLAAATTTTVVHSLFLHVPPFEVVPFDGQMEFVVGLMGAIREQLLEKKREAA